MLKIGRKGLVHNLEGIDSREIVLEWKVPNLINMTGSVGSGKTYTAIENIKQENAEKRALVVTAVSEQYHGYHGIRTIEKEVFTVNDIKLVDDILQIYPDYKLVVLDHLTLKNVLDFEEFYENVISLTTKYQDVLFLWITQEKLQENNSKYEKAFFGEKSVFFR